LDPPFHKNLFLKASYKVVYLTTKTKEAPHTAKILVKASCTGNGQAGLWTGREEKTGSGSLVI
jgi:hypothetical protein